MEDIINSGLNKRIPIEFSLFEKILECDLQNTFALKFKKQEQKYVLEFYSRTPGIFTIKTTKQTHTIKINGD